MYFLLLQLYIYCKMWTETSANFLYSDVAVMLFAWMAVEVSLYCESFVIMSRTSAGLKVNVQIK